MTVIEVNFLTGRYSATAHHDREQPEWPPHGARLFSAMVATWAEAEPPDEGERAALEWLEARPPPRISAPEAVPRRAVRHFVPVNDATVQDKKKEPNKLPRDLEGRVKKERFFPSVTPLEPRVTFAWNDSAPSAVPGALSGLLARVTRLGHSSSLVSCRLRDEGPAATHIPGTGTMMLRWVQPGQLAALEEEHRRHQAVRPRSLPFRGVRYGTVEPGDSGPASARRPDTAGEWIVFELEPAHRRMPLTRTVELVKVLRDAVLHHADDPLPEGLSGHRADGRPTTAPHVGFLALPNVGYEHSDGRVLGLAISLPEELDDVACKAALRAVGAWERRSGSRPLRLTLGHRGVVEMRRRLGPSALVALRREVWSSGSRRWTSATPVALPTHPGDLRRGSPAARAKAWARAEEAVLRSCGHVGLPVPADVQVSLTPCITGARPAADYPVFEQNGVVRRLVHVSLAFAEPVAGPLMLGSGRFVGLGLMRPVRDIPDDKPDHEGAVDE